MEYTYVFEGNFLTETEKLFPEGLPPQSLLCQKMLAAHRLARGHPSSEYEHGFVIL